MLCRNRTFQTNAIKRNNSAVVLGSLNCMGFENDIGFCKGGLDKSNCTDDIVNIDCTGKYYKSIQRFENLGI